MNCQVCGAESGDYPLCRNCNQKRETGEVIKCEKCGKWHYGFRYYLRERLISPDESEFYKAIDSTLPPDYHVFPKVSLQAFTERPDDYYHNELNKNVDFVITDGAYSPTIVVEIDDKVQISDARKDRDRKLANICKDAGIPITPLEKGHDDEIDYYIGKKIAKALALPPKKKGRAPKRLMSSTEDEFYRAIKSVLPTDCYLFAQVGLTAFIERKDYSPAQRKDPRKTPMELFKIVDFLIVDTDFSPKIAVEINDESHNNPDRKERDKEEAKIFEEAGIPRITLWTSCGVNQEYIRDKIEEKLASPFRRIHNFYTCNYREKSPD